MICSIQKKLLLACLLAAGFFPLLPSAAGAQQTGADTVILQSSLSAALHLYFSRASDQLGIFNGSLYPGYPFPFKKGSAFFSANRMDTGWVCYDGIVYERMPLKYDNLSGVVLVEDNGYMIELNSKSIGAFSIAGHLFIRLEKNDSSNKDVITGFYEVLFSGSHIRLLKRIAKTVVDDLSGGELVEKLIQQEDFYYLCKAGTCFLVEGRGGIGDILSDRKTEVRQFMRKNKVKFREERENTLSELAAYYEQISK